MFVELMLIVKKCLFANSPMDTTIEDSGKRERSMVRSTVFQLDVTTRGNIDMCDGIFEEHFCYSVFLSELKMIDPNYFIFIFSFLICYFLFILFLFLGT